MPCSLRGMYYEDTPISLCWYVLLLLIWISLWTERRPSWLLDVFRTVQEAAIRILRKEGFGQNMDLDIRQPFLSRQNVHHDEDEREENRTKEKQACVGILCHLISRSTKWLVGSATWIGRGLSCVCAQQRDITNRVSIDLTPIQEERLRRLKCRVEVAFDPESEDHQKSFQRLLKKQEGNRATWEYPFAVAGVNITFMLIQMLDLRSKKPSTLMGAIFLKMLAEDEWAFDLLYCITFEMMDAQWLAMQASYMEFNDVMKATRSQLERELQMEDVFRLEDMPSYSLLSR